MAASDKCNLCGARFDVPGAVGDLDHHMKSFHPGNSKSAKPEGDDDTTPAEAIEALQEAVERISTLETEIAGLRAENERLKAETSDEPPTVADADLGKLTKPQLEELAAQEGADLSDASNNEERAEAIRKHRAAS